LAFYDFELFSNFTFFLDDSLNGDQIKQKESRQLFGFKSEIKRYFDNTKWKGSLAAAIGLRNDQTTDSELSHTLQRQTTLNQIQLGDVDESNYFGFVNAEFQVGKWLFNPAMRIDYFANAYYDKLQSTYSNQSASAMTLSPKLNVLYNYSNHLQLYLKTGRGFHSNDTRVVVPQNGKSILPAAHGADLGFIWKPYSRLMINAAGWYLFLQQEFVYVGDAGIVELSGQSARKGIDIGLRYEITHWLYADADVNSAIARSVNEESGNNYIPLAPALTATGGLSVVHPSGFYGGIRCRIMTDRPANEDNTIVAKGYSVTDVNAGYKFKRVDVGIKIENVFNTKWNETQFATESQLQNEAESVEEIHFTPGTPFFLKGSLAYRF
ncbi:MAG: TonB-dependent receptor domain-containing protein, partial [Flavobacteriales bacterium]